jgi:hypothetical protein
VDSPGQVLVLHVRLPPAPRAALGV